MGYKLEEEHMFDKLASLRDMESVLTMVGLTMAAIISVSRCPALKCFTTNLNL